MKTASEKPKSKPSNLSGIIKNPITKSVNDASSQISKVKAGKKSVNFQEYPEEIKEKGSKEADKFFPQTPVRSPLLMKSRVPSTPYLSAEKCGKCRFDKLETSSYWISQIKLAESVGKHFVSANFFKIAIECRAEVRKERPYLLHKFWVFDYEIILLN